MSPIKSDAQAEPKAHVEAELSARAIPASVGIFYVFLTPLDVAYEVAVINLGREADVSSSSAGRSPAPGRRGSLGRPKPLARHRSVLKSTVVTD
jgi:hypothetical protein